MLVASQRNLAAGAGEETRPCAMMRWRDPVPGVSAPPCNSRVFLLLVMSFAVDPDGTAVLLPVCGFRSVVLVQFVPLCIPSGHEYCQQTNRGRRGGRSSP